MHPLEDEKNLDTYVKKLVAKQSDSDLQYNYFDEIDLANDEIILLQNRIREQERELLYVQKFALEVHEAVLRYLDRRD